MEEKRALMCRNLRGELTVTDVAPTLRAEMDFMQTVASVMGLVFRAISYIRNTKNSFVAAAPKCLDLQSPSVVSTSLSLSRRSREEYDEIRSELHPLLLCAAARRGDLAWLKSMIVSGDFFFFEISGRSPS